MKETLRRIWGAQPSSGDRPRGRRRMRTQWSSGQLSSIFAAEIIGSTGAFMTREQAMTLPPVVKGRAIIAGQIAPAPLRVLTEEGVTDTQPRWLYRTDGNLTPHHRMLWTVDDLIFNGWSLWGTPRDAAGQIETAERIPTEWWHFDAEGQIVVNDEVVSAEEVVLIPGPSEGFLEYATRSMRGAMALEEAYVKRANNPVPLVELHETTDNAYTDDEIDGLIEDYWEARNDPKGTVTFTPFNLELKTHGDQAPQLAIEGRNFAKVDTANFLNLPAAALDGSLSTASLTYSTQEGTRNELLDYSLSYWADPIAARFSQDDCVAEGSRVRFDFSELRSNQPSPTGPVTKD
ncbi:phage portal protein [Plantibacter flavus]|uniref:phage portal protein n=1 Tax=Plantibacter flavus TaxID=150123 RepID=UPI003F5CF504